MSTLQDSFQSAMTQQPEEKMDVEAFTKKALKIAGLVAH